MNLPRLAPACAVASLFLLAAAPAWAQGDSAPGSQDEGAQSGPQARGDSGQGNDTQSLGTTKALPGVAIERNVFVPVDSSGHSMGNQYIVVERRVLTPKGTGGDDSGAPATEDVPTRFILVPQEADDDPDESPSK